MHVQGICDPIIIRRMLLRRDPSVGASWHKRGDVLDGIDAEPLPRELEADAAQSEQRIPGEIYRLFRIHQMHYRPSGQPQRLPYLAGDFAFTHLDGKFIGAEQPFTARTIGVGIVTV